MGKAIRKAATEPRSDRAPSLARAELLGKAARGRLEDEVSAALKRKPSSEVKLAGALRAVAPLSPQLRASMAEAASVMVRRRSFSRELYSACLRSLAEAQDPTASTIVKEALGADDAGGAATLGAACSVRDAVLAPMLSKIAASRQSHLAFAAETARVARGESNGGHLLAIAPMIKEAHRISLCLDLFVPLTRSTPVPVAIAPALAVLREAERHLGRWLVLAEVAARAGDPRPAEEANERATGGPHSSRAAWSLVAWALADAVAHAKGATRPAPPTTRPTVEIVARLSDRPSADRDPTFLFRLAAARASGARPMLEALVKGASGSVVKAGHGPITDDVAVRAALYLARDHGRDDLRAALVDLAKNPRREELRGIAAAALWDLRMKDEALGAADELAVSKLVTNIAWAALVRAASQRASSAPAFSTAPASAASRANGAASGVGATPPELVTEAAFRWMHWGWLE